MSNALRIGNRSISYEQAKEMLFPELIPQKGNEGERRGYGNRVPAGSSFGERHDDVHQSEPGDS